MATLADKTAAQIQALKDGDALMRGAIVDLHRALRSLSAAVEQYNDATVPIISDLDGTEDIPTVNGLAGALPFAKADQGFLASYAQAVLDNFNTNLNDSAHRVLYVKAAGSVNL